jgi:hypothetical protein
VKQCVAYLRISLISWNSDCPHRTGRTHLPIAVLPIACPCAESSVNIHASALDAAVSDRWFTSWRRVRGCRGGGPWARSLHRPDQGLGSPRRDRRNAGPGLRLTKVNLLLAQQPPNRISQWPLTADPGESAVPVLQPAERGSGRPVLGFPGAAIQPRRELPDHRDTDGCQHKPSSKILAPSGLRWSSRAVSRRPPGLAFHEAVIEANSQILSLVFSDLTVQTVDPGYAPFVVPDDGPQGS